MASFASNLITTKYSYIMKKFAIGIMAFAAIAFASCSKDDDSTTPSSSNVLPSTVEAGQTYTLKADGNYILSSAVRVKDGATLEIKEGVTVTAQGGQPTSMFIIVEQGGKIMAKGTDDKPIVFTAADKNRGAWGGLIVAGKAPINLGETAIGEVGDVEYGGTDASDNSGIISYVRTEYTGSEINTEKQHNGFSFYGVGNGTQIDHIQAYMGGDDGIEFFGGTVNASYVVSMACGDDMVDWAEGYSGTLDKVYIEQSSDASLVQDKGIEGDNLKANNGANPVSNPTVKNVTIVGKPGIKNGDDEAVDGMRLREGTKGTFDNIVIKGYSDEGIDVRSLATLENVNDGSLSFTNLFIENVGDKDVDGKVDSGEDDTTTDADDAKAAIKAAIVGSEPTGADYNSWKGNWTKSL